MISFTVLEVNKKAKLVRVAFGPIKFMVQVIERDDKKPLVLKPTSVYIDNPDFYEMIETVRSAWLYNE